MKLKYLGELLQPLGNAPQSSQVGGPEWEGGERGDGLVGGDAGASIVHASGVKSIHEACANEAPNACASGAMSPRHTRVSEAMSLCDTHVSEATSPSDACARAPMHP